MYNERDRKTSMPKVVDSDERRHDLTDAAARVIARSGPEAATMRAVAAEAGWTTGVLTHYFRDKHELLLATFQASLRHRRSMRPASADVDAPTRLRRSLLGALPLDDDRRRHWLVTLACCTQSPAQPELASAQRDAYREYRDHIATLVGELDHDVRTSLDADPVDLAERLIALADGLAVQALFDPETWPAERQRRALHDGVRTTAGITLDPEPVTA